MFTQSTCEIVKVHEPVALGVKPLFTQLIVDGFPTQFTVGVPASTVGVTVTSASTQTSSLTVGVHPGSLGCAVDEVTLLAVILGPTTILFSPHPQGCFSSAIIPSPFF